MESVKKLKSLAEVLNERIGSILLAQASGFLKGAHEIPRLYRRTNRDAPKTASNYIKQTLQSFIDFDTEWMKMFNAGEFDDQLHKIIDQTCLK